MSRKLGPLSTELSEAESAKFTAPLVLVHGLWDQPRSWRRFTAFLSHRGWRCIAVGWPNGADTESLAARQQTLQRALAQLDDPPVLVGHDLGGLLAMRLADQSRAVVALAPLTPILPPALASSGTWLQRWRGAARTPGRALAAAYPMAQQPEPRSIFDDWRCEPAAPPAASTPTPRLVIAGADDPLVTPDDVRRFATAHRAEAEVISGQHALHVDDGWEAAAARVHRWLIRSLGQDLLALYEEAWADREPEP